MLFDLDNTITDRKRSVAAVARQLRRDFGPRLVSCRPRAIVGILAGIDGDGYHTRQEIAAGLVAELPWIAPPTPEAMLAYWHRTFPICTCPRTGLYPLLVALKANGLRLAIVGNGSTHAQLAKIRRLGILPYFDTILVSEAVGVAKPHPEIFHFAVEELGVAPSEAWFLGDHPTVDILSAERAGLVSVWLAGCHPWPESAPPPSLQIRRLGDLRDLLWPGSGVSGSQAPAATCSKETVPTAQRRRPR